MDEEQAHLQYIMTLHYLVFIMKSVLENVTEALDVLAQQASSEDID